MKNLAIMICTACILTGAAVNADVVNTNEGSINPPTREELIQRKKVREAAFEQRLGLTEEQKAKAKELRIQGRQKMKPIMDEIKNKKQEAKMIKQSRMAVQMQEEKLVEIDKDLRALEKKANDIRKQNMKDFESILTRKQRQILKNMKKEGRKTFEKEHQLNTQYDKKND